MAQLASKDKLSLLYTVNNYFDAVVGSKQHDGQVNDSCTVRANMTRWFQEEYPNATTTLLPGDGIQVSKIAKSSGRPAGATGKKFQRIKDPTELSAAKRKISAANPVQQTMAMVKREKNKAHKKEIKDKVEKEVKVV